MPLFKKNKKKEELAENKRSKSTSDDSDSYEQYTYSVPLLRSGARKNRDPPGTEQLASLQENISETNKSNEVKKEETNKDSKTKTESVDSTKLKTEDDKASNILYCEPCLQGQKENTAVGLCKNCSEDLCDECYRTHKNHKYFRNHELQVLDTISRDSQSQNEITMEDPPETVVEDKCTIHDEPKIYEYYCKSCDQLACSICMFKQHRSCQQVELIEDVIKTFQDSSECKEFTEDLEKVKAGFAECDDTIKTSMVNNQVYRDNARISVSIQVKKISDQLKEAERNIKSEIFEKFENEQKEINEINKKHEEWHRQIKIINTQIEHCRNSGYINLLFIYIKKAREILDNLKVNVQEMKRNTEIKRYGIKVKNLTEDLKTLFQLTEEQDCLESGSDEVIYLTINT